MRFRDYYNSIEDLPKCHTVIEKEVACLRQNAINLWRLFENLSSDLHVHICKDLKSKSETLKSQRLSLLTEYKESSSTESNKIFDMTMEQSHKQISDSKVKDSYIQACMTKTRQSISPHDSINDTPLFYVDVDGLPSIADGRPMAVKRGGRDDGGDNEDIEKEGMSEKELNVEGVDQSTMSQAEEEKTPEPTSTGDDDKPMKQLNVLVHGLQGSSEDMSKIMIYLDEYMPDSITISSKANEAAADSELFLKGRRLAEELIEFQKDISKTYTITKINFIGHSTGKLLLYQAV
jgi:Putative serine esterase (DUF676)